MKKIIYSLLFILTVVFTACEEELPKANFDLYELKSLTATAGDMNVTLAWEMGRHCKCITLYLKG